MGKIKNGSNVAKTHTLSERQWNLLKIMNAALQFNTMRDKIFSGYLYDLCHYAFRYPEDTNLIFELDLEDEKRELKVKQVPTEVIQKALKKQ